MTNGRSEKSFTDLSYESKQSKCIKMEIPIHKHLEVNRVKHLGLPVILAQKRPLLQSTVLGWMEWHHMVHCLLIFNSTTEYSSVFSPRANFQQQTVIVRETGANLELQSASVIVDNGTIASCVLGTSSHGKPRSGRCKTTVRSSGKWGTWKCKRFEEQGRRWARGREFGASAFREDNPPHRQPPPSPSTCTARPPTLHYSSAISTLITNQSM